MQLKITGSQGRETVTEPGITLRITGGKLKERSMREEVAKLLLRSVPRLVEKTLGEQLEISDFNESGAKKKK